MKIEDLPEDDQKVVRGLKHNPGTIEYDVLDSLENARNLSEFRELVKASMQKLRDEAYEVQKLLGDD